MADGTAGKGQFVREALGAEHITFHARFAPRPTRRVVSKFGGEQVVLPINLLDALATLRLASVARKCPRPLCFD
jgi:hypothetical protein